MPNQDRALHLLPPPPESTAKPKRPRKRERRDKPARTMGDVVRKHTAKPPRGIHPRDVYPVAQLAGPDWGKPDPGAARGVCDSLERCSPWAAHRRTPWLDIVGWAGWAIIAAAVLATMFALGGGASP